MYKNFNQFEGNSGDEFLLWVKKSVRLNYFNQLHRDAAEMEFYNEELNFFILPTKGRMDWISSFEQFDFMESLHETLKTLTAQERLIIQLRYFENLSFVEISEKIGVSLHVLKVIWKRTLMKLRAARAKESYKQEK